MYRVFTWKGAAPAGAPGDRPPRPAVRWSVRSRPRAGADGSGDATGCVRRRHVRRVAQAGSCRSTEGRAIGLWMVAQRTWLARAPTSSIAGVVETRRLEL